MAFFRGAGPPAQSPDLLRVKSPRKMALIMSAEKPGVEAAPEKRRLTANVVLVAMWVYVAMIYLLALDQQFRWGIFDKATRW